MQPKFAVGRGPAQQDVSCNRGGGGGGGGRRRRCWKLLKLEATGTRVAVRTLGRRDELNYARE